MSEPTTQPRSDYLTLTPSGPQPVGREPFRFQFPSGEKFELPALDSANVPLPLIPIFLALAGGQVDTDEDKIRIAGSFIAFIEREHPKLWRTLKRQPDAIRWILGLIEQWGEHSKLGPQPPASGD